MRLGLALEFLDPSFRFLQRGRQRVLLLISEEFCDHYGVLFLDFVSRFRWKLTLVQTTARTGLDAAANAGVEIAEFKVMDQCFDSSGCYFSHMT